MAVNIHITIIELNALHTKRQNLFQELDAVIHLLMEAKHWGLRKSRNATSLNSRFKSLDTLKVKIISVTFRRVIRTNRSYYPSECHADYFDFERIEALKPAIEACGISTLSQSPMLGFHKQMDNRIKLLEEILSFRMQGVEFDNGDMYVDGHKAASDVRDEFVSVTEKLMDKLAQCYNVLPQLDINNTIDHRPEGDEKWFLENEKTVTQFCRKLAAERPLKDIRDEYNYPKKKGIKDECSRLLEASTMKSRRGFAIQRLMNAMRQAHADGWFIVFDTLTLADDRLEAFYDNPNALRDYFRDIGRMVLAAEGRKANDSHAD